MQAKRTLSVSIVSCHNIWPVALVQRLGNDNESRLGQSPEVRELDIISTTPFCVKDPSTNITFEYVRIQSMTIWDSQVESQRGVLSQRWLDNSPLTTSRGKSWTSWRKTNLKIIVNPSMGRHKQCFIWITMAYVCLFCWFVHPNH